MNIFNYNEHIEQCCVLIDDNLGDPFSCCTTPSLRCACEVLPDLKSSSNDADSSINGSLDKLAYGCDGKRVMVKDTGSNSVIFTMTFS